MMSWVRSLVCVIQQADLPRMHLPAAEEREDRLGAIARLLREAREIDRAPVDPGRRPGLQPSHRQVQLAQARGQRERGRITRPSRPVPGHADVDEAAEECPGGEHDGRGPQLQADRGHRAHDPISLHEQVVDRRLEEPEVGLGLEPAADRAAVEHPIRLGARRAHRRSLARVQGPELDAGLVGGECHGAAQGVDLPHEVPLADAADRGIARHLAQRLEGMGEQARAGAGPGRRERRLRAGVTAANDDDVETMGGMHQNAVESDPENSTRKAHGGRRCSTWNARVQGRSTWNITYRCKTARRSPRAVRPRSLLP